MRMWVVCHRSVKQSHVACRHGLSSALTRWVTVTWHLSLQLSDAVLTPHAARGIPDNGPWSVPQLLTCFICFTLLLTCVNKDFPMLFLSKAASLLSVLVLNT